MTVIQRLGLDEKDPVRINSAINQIAEYIDLLSTANLSDYAQGAWTPTVIGRTTAGTATYSLQVGSYEKIGRLVIARFNVTLASWSGAAGTAQVGGLPFAIGSITSDGGRGLFTTFTGVTLDAGYTFMTGGASVGSTAVDLNESGSTLTTIRIPVANLSATTTNLAGFVTYHT